MIAQEITLGHHYEKNMERFVDLAGSFASSIRLEAGSQKRVNGKSMVGLQALGVTGRDEITLLIHGADQEIALRRLSEILED